jgi:hypothetical protein
MSAVAQRRYHEFGVVNTSWRRLGAALVASTAQYCQTGPCYRATGRTGLARGSPASRASSPCSSPPATLDPGRPAARRGNSAQSFPAGAASRCLVTLGHNESLLATYWR